MTAQQQELQPQMLQQQQQKEQLLHAGNATDTATATANISSCSNMELSENFYIDNRRKQNIHIQVKLTAAGIYLRRKTEQEEHINEQLIQMSEIIGTRCGPRLKKRTRGRPGLNSCKRAAADNNNEDEDDDNNETTTTTTKDSNNITETGDGDTSAYLYIYAYLRKEKPLRRVQTLRILRFRSHELYAENLKTAARWHQAIRHYKGKVALQPPPNMANYKQLLILLNPKSGSGKGRELFQKQVAPLLREAEAQYELHITTHAHYAQEFVRTRKDLLERYNGIVVASGDGLFYEVLNGMMERIDWRRVCRELPLGIIPCGSGNGLAKSIAHHCNEPYEPKPILHATLTCVAGHATPMDVVRVETEARGQFKIMYSFLSIGWGLIADIDIQSERLRSIGAQRFTLWAIKRVINLRSYHGKLHYQPIDVATTTTTTTKTTAATAAAATTITKQQATAVLTKQNNININNNNNSSTFHDIPEELAAEVFTDDFTDVNDNDSIATDTATTSTSSEQFQDVHSTYRQHTDSWHSATSQRTAYYSVGGQSSSMRSNRSRHMPTLIEMANAEFAERVPTGTLPTLKLPIDNSIHDGWCSEEDDYVMVHAAYTTHLASDCYFAPDSRLNDGIIYLVIIRAGVSRPQLINFLLGMSTGTHLPSEPDPYIRIIPVRAFRIEPSEQQGILTVDGERVDYGPIQAEVFPGLINVMVTETAENVNK